MRRFWNSVRCPGLLGGLLLVVAALAASAQTTNYLYATNNGGITITGYTGPDSLLVVPGTIDGLPVTALGKGAFYRQGSLLSVTLPPSLVTLGEGAFWGCAALTNVALGDQVTTLEAGVFWGCAALPSLTLPATVTYIGDVAFAGCDALTGLYFRGNAPQAGQDLFLLGSDPIIYYLPGATGWGSAFGGQPTAPWVSSTLSLTVSPAASMTNAFTFTITGTPNASVVVEASPSLGTPAWTPVSTNVLVNGSWLYSDPQWKTVPIRFYRARAL